MTIDGFYGALPIEEMPVPPATIQEIAAAGSEATLDEMLPPAVETGSAPLETMNVPVDLVASRESFMADLWVSDRASLDARQWTDFTPHPEAVPSVDSDTVADFDTPTSAGKDRGLIPMSFEEWNEVPEFDEQYAQEVRNWYGFAPWDDLSDRLEEWGRQIAQWIDSILPGGGR